MKHDRYNKLKPGDIVWELECYRGYDLYFRPLIITVIIEEKLKIKVIDTVVQTYKFVESFFTNEELLRCFPSYWDKEALDDTIKEISNNYAKTIYKIKNKYSYGISKIGNRFLEI